MMRKAVFTFREPAGRFNQLSNCPVHQAPRGRRRRGENPPQIYAKKRACSQTSYQSYQFKHQNNWWFWLGPGGGREMWMTNARPEWAMPIPVAAVGNW